MTTAPSPVMTFVLDHRKMGMAQTCFVSPQPPKNDRRWWQELFDGGGQAQELHISEIMDMSSVFHRLGHLSEAIFVMHM
jgi:hypothetical protein